MPVIVMALLCLIALGIAALGYRAGWRCDTFPWVVVILTPLFLGGIFSLLGDHDFFSGTGCMLDGMASVVFLVGTLAGRGIKYWISIREHETSERI